MSEPWTRTLDEVWTALKPHIEWPQGLALILLFADHPHPIDDFRGRTEALVQRVHAIVPHSNEELTTVLPKLFTPLADRVRVVWVELWRGSGGSGWDAQVSDILQQLNERRTVLERYVHRPTVLVLPAAMRTRVYVLAPDLWTVRSFTADLPSPQETHVPSAREFPVQRTFASGPPSAEEKEWARLLTTGEHARIDAWDGLQALGAAVRRGSLASARRIAQQIVTLLVRGEVRDDASLMTTDELLQLLQDGGIPKSRNLLAAVSGLAEVEVQAGNLSVARLLFQRAHDMSEQLAAADPQSTQAQRDLSVALIKFGDFEVRADNLFAARSLFQRSLDIREQLASAEPNSAHACGDLSVSLGNLGDVERKAGNFAAARSLLQRSLDICEQLASANPYDATAQLNLSVSLSALANLEVEAGNLSAARSLFQRSLHIGEQLASAAPHSARMLRNLSISLNELGNVEIQAGNLSAARSLLKRSLDFFEQLARTDPHNAQAQLDLIRAHARTIELGDQLDDPQSQREHLHAADSILASLDAQGLVDSHPEAISLRRSLETARERLEAISSPREDAP